MCLNELQFKFVVDKAWTPAPHEPTVTNSMVRVTPASSGTGCSWAHMPSHAHAVQALLMQHGHGHARRRERPVGCMTWQTATEHAHARAGHEAASGPLGQCRRCSWSVAQKPCIHSPTAAALAFPPIDPPPHPVLCTTGAPQQLPRRRAVGDVHLQLLAPRAGHGRGRLGQLAGARAAPACTRMSVRARSDEHASAPACRGWHRELSPSQSASDEDREKAVLCGLPPYSSRRLHHDGPGWEACAPKGPCYMVPLPAARSTRCCWRRTQRRAPSAPRPTCR